MVRLARTARPEVCYIRPVTVVKDHLLIRQGLQRCRTFLRPQSVRVRR